LPEIERCYTLLRSRRDELAEGWVWLRDRDVHDQVRRRRPIAKVTHTLGGEEHVIHCEMVYADDTDIEAFADENKLEKCKVLSLLGEPDRRAVFMSSWYREKLGIERDHDKDKCVRLTIELTGTRSLLLRVTRGLLWQVYACADHPQVVVRLATWLGLVGLGLGVIGVGLGFLALDVRSIRSVQSFGILVLIAGIVEAVWSTTLVFSKRRLTTPGAVDISGNEAATRIVPQMTSPKMDQPLDRGSR